MRRKANFEEHGSFSQERYGSLRQSSEKIVGHNDLTESEGSEDL